MPLGAWTRGGRAGSSSDDVVEVELVDAPDDAWFDEHPEPDPTGGDDPATTPRSRRRRVGVPAAAVGVVVALVLGANVGQAWSERKRLAALAELPGVVGSLAEPVEELWRTEGSWPLAQFDGTVLVESPEALLAVDTATGRIAWERDRAIDGGEYCFPIDPGGWGYHPARAFAPAAEPPRIACQPTGWTAPDGAADPGGADATVTVLDSRTGLEIAAYPWRGATVMLEAVDPATSGGDVLLVLADADARLRMVRWDPAADEERWARDLTMLALPPQELWLDRFERRGDAVVLGVGGGEVVLDVGTGEELTSPPAAEPDGPAASEVTERYPLPGGGEAVWTYDQLFGVFAPEGVGHVEDADGEVLFDLPGLPLVPQVHDGSMSGVLVVSRSDAPELTGLDSRTGEELWTLERGGVAAVGQLGGLLLVHDVATVFAVRAEDGTVAWEVETGGQDVFGAPPVTDGSVMLVTEPPRRGAGTALVGYSVRDGEEVWRAGLPDVVHALLPTADGHLLAFTETGMVGLG